MGDYLADMNAYADRVAALIEGDPDIRVVRATAIHNGWDDGVIIACGETETTIIVRAQGVKEMHIEDQVKGSVPRLRKREAARLANEKAIADSFARFYV